MNGYRHDLEEVYAETLRFFREEGMEEPAGHNDRETCRNAAHFSDDPAGLLDRGRLLSQFEKL